jgi:SecD/SecF fusion protein
MAPSRWKLVLYGLVILFGLVIAAPNLFSPSQLAALPDWMPKRQVALGLDLKGGAQLTLELDMRAVATDLSGAALRARQASALEESIEIVRRRVDAFGVAEPTVQRLGTDRILVQLPGVQDPAVLRTLLGSTAKLTFHRVRSVAGPGAITAHDSLGNAYVLEQRPLLEGEHLVDAGTQIDRDTASLAVTFRFDDAGSKIFATVTKENVGRQFAMVLDGKVLSAPVIQEPITGGTGRIVGHFTTTEASSLAALLRAGALPVPLTIMHEQMVNADLGSDAIRMGAWTGLAGFVLVLGFMTVLYRAWGLVANLALLLNVALTFAALTLCNVTLTLPGIAGIVLGIGLAVDANVLINERIREETRHGKAAAVALRNGFSRAYATIIDSNVTTLIATAFLFAIGSGAVQGFAVTMALGIAISMFTAVSVVHAMMSLWVYYRRPGQFSIDTLLPRVLTQRTPTFRFMRARFIGIGLSLVLSIASAALFVKPGLNYGVDFTGGVLIEARWPEASKQAPDLARMRARLDQLDVGAVSLQSTASSSVLVRIEQPEGATDGAQSQVVARVRSALAEIAPEVRFDRGESVGPKVSGELTDAGILAVLFASVAMFLYIWVRFDRGFAVGAIITLALDITKTLGFFALTGIEFNLTAIAALLTLIGYSVNDKVVVYDRMRENLRLHPDRPLDALIDDSINTTLARSLYTSITALLAMLPMAMWGGPAVASFAQPVVFGIVIAASSSVFIAAPILLFLHQWQQRRR